MKKDDLVEIKMPWGKKFLGKVVGKKGLNLVLNLNDTFPQVEIPRPYTKLKVLRRRGPNPKRP